jgi:hypothetical protein
LQFADFPFCIPRGIAAVGVLPDRATGGYPGFGKRFGAMDRQPFQDPTAPGAVFAICFFVSRGPNHSPIPPQLANPAQKDTSCHLWPAVRDQRANALPHKGWQARFAGTSRIRAAESSRAAAI